MKLNWLNQFINLVEFLGLALGPDYEVSLHDLTKENKPIIAIANGQITGRTINSPLTSPMLGFLNEKYYEKNNHEVNYTVFNMNQKKLRSSTFYIKDNNDVIGLLCITFDDERYRDITKAIMKLCHPSQLLEEDNFVKVENLITSSDTAIYGRNINEVFNHSIQSVLKEIDTPIEELSKEDKSQIIADLDKKGIFLLKGAVSEIAKLLDSSEATIYRYINEVREINNVEFDI